MRFAFAAAAGLVAATLIAVAIAVIDDPAPEDASRLRFAVYLAPGAELPPAADVDWVTIHDRDTLEGARWGPDGLIGVVLDQTTASVLSNFDENGLVVVLLGVNRNEALFLRRGAPVEFESRASGDAVALVEWHVFVRGDGSAGQSLVLPVADVGSVLASIAAAALDASAVRMLDYGASGLTAGALRTAPTPQPTPPSMVAPEIPSGVPLVAPAAGRPTAILDETGWPRGAVGPLVVYSRELRVERRTETGPGYTIEGVTLELQELVVYDLGAGREVAAFEVGSRGSMITGVAGRRLLAAYGRSIWSYGLDGSDGRELVSVPEGQRLSWLTVAPSGRLIAFSREVTDGWPDAVWVEAVDAASATVILSVHQSSGRLAGFTAPIAPTGWSADESTIFLIGDSGSERPAGRGLVTLSGEVRLLQRDDDPRRFADLLGELPTVTVAGGLPACAVNGYAGVTEIALIDPRTEDRINDVRAEWPSLHIAAWSPSGDEFSYLQHELTPTVGAAVVRAYEANGCASFELAERAWALPSGWWVLRVDGSPPLEVGTRKQLNERWYGARAVTFACGDEVKAGSPPFSSPQFETPACNEGVDYEVRVGGVPVGEGHGIRVLGFVEAP